VRHNKLSFTAFFSKAITSEFFKDVVEKPHQWSEKKFFWEKEGGCSSLPSLLVFKSEPTSCLVWLCSTTPTPHNFQSHQ